jgi:predicted membrane protein
MTKKGNKIIRNLRNKHRFVLINDDSFAEVFSIRLTPLNILSLASGLFIFFTFLIYLLFAFTPMRSLIPNKIAGSDREELIQLNQELEDLKLKIEVKNSKTNTLNNLLSNKETVYDSTSVRMNSKPNE